MAPSRRTSPRLASPIAHPAEREKGKLATSGRGSTYSRLLVRTQSAKQLGQSLGPLHVEVVMLTRFMVIDGDCAPIDSAGVVMPTTVVIPRKPGSLHVERNMPAKTVVVQIGGAPGHVSPTIMFIDAHRCT